MRSGLCRGNSIARRRPSLGSGSTFSTTKSGGPTFEQIELAAPPAHRDSRSGLARSPTRPGDASAPRQLGWSDGAPIMASIMVRHVRVCLRGSGGSGCQPAIACTQRRAFALSAIPRKCRRSSTTADSSLLASNALRMSRGGGFVNAEYDCKNDFGRWRGASTKPRTM
jgi:hypothetical protein